MTPGRWVLMVRVTSFCPRFRISCVSWKYTFWKHKMLCILYPFLVLPLLIQLGVNPISKTSLSDQPFPSLSKSSTAPIDFPHNWRPYWEGDVLDVINLQTSPCFWCTNQKPKASASLQIHDFRTIIDWLSPIMTKVYPWAETPVTSIGCIDRPTFDQAKCEILKLGCAQLRDCKYLVPSVEWETIGGLSLQNSL